ncbi:MAG TPA: PilZ domain-containing protein [Candidatus Acidoferrales bacterium]|nr:PilZ domain-containing protein [Candidatus Acidoferrales bacterium]
MTESVQSNDPEVQKRRSTRIAQSVPITVTGVDALGQTFKERTSTVSVNCHGCKYQSRHYVPKNSTVTFEIPRPQDDQPPRIVEGRVAWVQRPRSVKELFQIGVEFVVPGNVWGIAFPPADWFPVPNEEISEIPAPTAIQEQTAALEPSAEAPTEEAERSGHVPATTLREEPAIAAPARAATPTPAPPAESRVRVLPTPAQAQETMSMARQMARLLSEAKQHLQRTMQSGAAEAVAQEVRTAREQIEMQLRGTVSDAVEASVSKTAEQTVQNAVQQSLQQLVEQATQQVVQNALAAFEKARQAASPSAQELDTKVRAAVERVVETSAAKMAEQTIQQSVQQTVEHAVKQSVQKAVQQATANLSLAPSAASETRPGEDTLRELEETARARLVAWRQEVEEVASEVQARSIERLNAGSEAATSQWRERFEQALQGASAQMGEQLNQISQAATARAAQELSARGASLQNLLNEAAAQAQKNMDLLCSNLETERTKTELVLGKADEVARRAEDTSVQLEAMSQATFDEARRQLEALLASQTEQMNRRAEDVIREKSAGLEKPAREVADGALRRLAEQVQEQLQPHIARAEQVSQQLAAADVQAEDSLRKLRERMHEISEQALAASLERMRQQTAEFPAEFEQSCRTALARVQEELEAKSTDATHSTFEAMYKSAEWYQKKAQTSMQAALEKVLEQSTGTMRERAGELSRLFASELDHYSRSYVDQAKETLQEDAKEVKEQTRAQLEETAKTATASLSDEFQRIMGQSLGRFEQATKTSTAHAQDVMKEGADKAMGDFDSHLEERMVQGATLARKHLESQLKPLIDAFYTKRTDEQNEWLEQMKGVVEQSIEQYKERLENTSNSWLLASATTLGQHSKGVLETLSKAAEERLRDTCGDVFADLGDKLRARLLGLSSDVSTEKKTPEKK